MVYHQDRLDHTFGALADPTRREILARLAGGDKTISELAARFDMTLPAVSKHVRVLERAGLATVRREGRVRRMRLAAEPMREALAWIERYRRFWEYQLDQLAAYLEQSTTAETITCQPTPPPRPAAPPRRSKSAARSARRDSASSKRGRGPRK